MRCFYSTSIGNVGELLSLNKAEHRHLFKTLRARPGEKIQFMDGKGVVATAIIEQYREIRILEVENITPPNIKLHLWVAIPKRQKMNQLLKQCSEIGVTSIQPMITEWTVAGNYKKETIERWETILQEGCKQSANPFTPVLHTPKTFDELIRETDISAYCPFYGAVKSGRPDFPTRGERDLMWIIGPEGGFTESELTTLEKTATPLQIGNSIMRVETAVITGASLLLFNYRNQLCN